MRSKAPELELLARHSRDKSMRLVAMAGGHRGRAVLAWEVVCCYTSKISHAHTNNTTQTLLRSTMLPAPIPLDP
jgi:hypothetical protein